jgi:acetyltransferase-like isoleucine patch superfamily enzyme
MFILEFINRNIFWLKIDRIAPDVPNTHWLLHYKSLMKKLCNRKFKHFGKNSEVRYGSYIDCCSKISIGDNVIIRPGSFIYADPEPGGSGILIEDYVLLGSNIHIYTNNHNFNNTEIPIYFQGYPTASISSQVILRTGCWIGANVVILPGVEIGCNSVIGAGSVVTKSIPPKVLAVGNPAKIIKTL